MFLTVQLFVLQQKQYNFYLETIIFNGKKAVVDKITAWKREAILNESTFKIKCFSIYGEDFYSNSDEKET